MAKMQVRSVAQLVHLCDAIGKPDATQTGRAMVA
jgi:hypothetical protein